MDVLVCLTVSGQVSPPGCCIYPLNISHNICGISSPTRVKSRRNLLSFTGGIVTPLCPVMTRSSVPDSTAQATNPGSRSPPPHRLWCQKNGKAKLVSEFQAPPLNQSLSGLNQSPPSIVVTLCVASVWILWWFSVCVEKNHTLRLHSCLSTVKSLFLPLLGHAWSWMGFSLLLMFAYICYQILVCTPPAPSLGCLQLEYAEQHVWFLRRKLFMS